jgi:hypothetical protein
MKNYEYTEKDSRNSQEGDLQRNPLIVILVLIICVSALMGFAIAVKANEQPNSQKAAEKKIDTWRPPVAEAVILKPVVDKETAKRFAEKWGVELISLRLTSAGYMIDFRFRVLDVEKSNVFFDSRVKPLLVVERSNAKLPIPMAAKVGAFRTTNRGRNIKPDKIYYMVFGNPDAHVKSGERVTMVIGDFKAERLVVN